MSTRSTVGIEKEDGTVKTIYVHFDGYIENGVGAELYYGYTTMERARDLVRQGNSSTLQEPYTDRGESYSDNKPEKYASRNEAKQDMQEYFYLWTKEGMWYVSKHGGDFSFLGEYFGEVDPADITTGPWCDKCGYNCSC